MRSRHPCCSLGFEPLAGVRLAPMPRRECGEPSGDSPVGPGAASASAPAALPPPPEAPPSSSSIELAVSPLRSVPETPPSRLLLVAALGRRAVSDASHRARRITFSLNICEGVPPLTCCHLSRTRATVRDARSSSLSAASRQPICARHSKKSASVANMSQPSTGLAFDRFDSAAGASGSRDSSFCSSISAPGVYHSAWAVSLSKFWSTCRSMTSRRSRVSSCGRVEGPEATVAVMSNMSSATVAG